MKQLYISDNHYGHKNIIKLDHRSFVSVEEMDNEMIKRWNNKVNQEDIVYILGDFCWDKKERWIEILRQLNGQKCLILGNHDISVDKMGAELHNLFADIKSYKEIRDDGRKVILCHYPILCYNRDYSDNTYHLYGHVHTTDEEKYIRKFIEILKNDLQREDFKYQGQMYNVGAMMPYMDYTPQTLDEIIEKSTKF